MVVVDFTRKEEDDGKIKYTLDVQGHADYDPGHDIVCAACSVLTETYFHAVLKNVEKIASMYKHPGDCKMVFVTDKEGTVADTIYQTILSGFKLLSYTYPDNVHVK